MLQAVTICAIKFIFWHLAQVLFFWVAWWAFGELMGWPQYILATIIALRELWYLFLLMYAVVYEPQFLLFAPFSEESTAWRVVYFLSPDAFVADDVYRSVNQDYWQWLDLFARISGILSLCGWPALVCGFLQDGVMYPSLFLGYLLCGLSGFGFLTVNGFLWGKPPNMGLL